MFAAVRYAEIRARGRVRERELFPRRRTPNELELQAHWFAGDFGREFKTVDGHRVRIVQFGIWNREPGPDFIEAAVSIGGDEPHRGSIEFDLADRNWETHGHAENPAFDDTVLHVFVERGSRSFFTRTAKFGYIPQVQVDLAAIADKLASNIPLARAGRCHAPLRHEPDERIHSVLDAAAQFRLQQKARRFQRLAETHGTDEALFQETAAALGYKQNKLPFTLLAQRLPLKSLRKDSSAEASLFGLAGFLRKADLSAYQSGSREYVRQLWESWWPRRSEFERLVLPENVWKLGGARPLNHPQRRLGALAALIQDWSRFDRVLRAEDASKLSEFFRELRHPFWNFNYTLTSERSAKEMALIGDSRINEIFANVVYPALHAGGRDIWQDYARLPARLTNRRAETAAARLFADDPRRPHFMKTVAHQQALLQIYEDFCLQDNSDCAECPFPEQMKNWR